MNMKKLKMHALSSPSNQGLSATLAGRDESKADAHREINLPENVPPILFPWAGIYLTFRRRGPSFYSPSSLMMDYTLHHINLCLVDNHHFVRFSCPDYHPYILRLYYAVLFWIQILRANVAASTASFADTLFLEYFLKSHPPESLPVIGPLTPLFISLSASRPEIDTFGFVCPKLESPPGPERRSLFFRDSATWGMLPNVPGIFALLEHLNSLINNDDQPIYPNKGQHIPVSETNTVFGHHSFPEADQRSDNEKWALCSSGLQYPCEADYCLNQSFAEFYENFDFPATEANDNLTSLHNFPSLGNQTSWFTQVKNVAAIAANYFEGSGTLADCDPTGCCANQFVVCYERPAAPPPAPRFSVDPSSLFPFSFTLRTTVRNPPPLSDAISSVSQTNVLMFKDHPMYGASRASSMAGGFWNIRPVEAAPVNHNSYLDIPRNLMKMIKNQV